MPSDTCETEPIPASMRSLRCLRPPGEARVRSAGAQELTHRFSRGIEVDDVARSVPAGAAVDHELDLATIGGAGILQHDPVVVVVGAHVDVVVAAPAADRDVGAAAVD